MRFHRPLLFAFLFAVVTLNIPDNDLKAVENDVPDAVQWIKDAWAGKLAKCKTRIVKTEVDRCIKESKTIPSTETGIVDQFLARPDYVSRKNRDLTVK